MYIVPKMLLNEANLLWVWLKKKKKMLKVTALKIMEVKEFAYFVESIQLSSLEEMDVGTNMLMEILFLKALNVSKLNKKVW